MSLVRACPCCRVLLTYPYVRFNGRCCGGPCTSGEADGNNMCEPAAFVLKAASYTGKSMNGLGFNTCPGAHTTSTLCQQLYVGE